MRTINPPFEINQQMSASKSTHGGRRAGAGRPLGSRNTPHLLPTLPETQCPLEWLVNMMQCQAAPMRLRVAAARALLPYQHRPQ